MWKDRGGREGETECGRREGQRRARRIEGGEGRQKENERDRAEKVKGLGVE